jgi:hypothetical protein
MKWRTPRLPLRTTPGRKRAAESGSLALVVLEREGGYFVPTGAPEAGVAAGAEPAVEVAAHVP